MSVIPSVVFRLQKGSMKTVMSSCLRTFWDSLDHARGHFLGYISWVILPSLLSLSPASPPPSSLSPSTLPVSHSPISMSLPLFLFSLLFPHLYPCPPPHHYHHPAFGIQPIDVNPFWFHLSFNKTGLLSRSHMNTTPWLFISGCIVFLKKTTTKKLVCLTQRSVTCLCLESSSLWRLPSPFTLPSPLYTGTAQKLTMNWRRKRKRAGGIKSTCACHVWDVCIHLEIRMIKHGGQSALTACLLQCLCNTMSSCCCLESNHYENTINEQLRRLTSIL